MDDYYTKAEFRNEMKKLKAKKDGYEKEMNDWNKIIKSYLPGISSIREKIKKIDDESLDNTALDINKRRLNEELDEQKMLLECAREYYKNNRELFDATQNDINELEKKFQDSSSAASYEFFSPEKINLFTGLLVNGFVRGNKAVIRKLDFQRDPTKDSIVQATKEICFQERLNLLTIHFCQKQLNYDLIKNIDIETKSDGIQAGRILSLKDPNETIYYIKTHQHGAKYNENICDFFDARELIVYKVLEMIGIGPLTRFFYYDFNVKEFFIATEGLKSFVTFKQLLQIEKYKKLFDEDRIFKDKIVIIHTIGKILFLSDLANNLGNYGFIMDDLKLVSYKIIDFKVSDDLIYYNKHNGNFAFEKYSVKNISLSNKCEKHHPLFTIDYESKIATGKAFLEYLVEKDFLAVLESSLDFVFDYFNQTRIETKMNTSEAKQFKKIKDTAKEYIELVKTNFDVFKKGLNIKD